MLSPSFCFSFRTPCKHWCNNAFHYTEERRWVSLVAPLHLNNRSTAVFKKLITFLAVAKVSRDALRCNIGSSDQQQISAEMRKSCLWWVQHVNDLCVFIGHGAGPASLQDSGVGTTLWQRLATADGNKQERGGLTPLQHFTVCTPSEQNVSLSFSSPRRTVSLCLALSSWVFDSLFPIAWRLFLAYQQVYLYKIRFLYHRNSPRCHIIRRPFRNFPANSWSSRVECEL